jgi:hypothetical protein
MDGFVKSTIFAVASLLATASTAAASLVLESWDEGNPGGLVTGAIPGGSSANAVLSALGVTNLGGYYGSQIRLTNTSTVTYTFIGFEAAFMNRFQAGAESFYTEDFAGNNVVNLGGLASFKQTAGPGLLDFAFLTQGGANGIANGDENINNVGSGGVRNPDFFASIVGDDPTALSGFSLYVFLDDLGAGPDDDHDDLVVRIDVADIVPVPVPAAAFLAGTALVGFGFLRRRL